MNTKLTPNSFSVANEIIGEGVTWPVAESVYTDKRWPKIKCYQYTKGLLSIYRKSFYQYIYISKKLNSNNFDSNRNTIT